MDDNRNVNTANIAPAIDDEEAPTFFRIVPSVHYSPARLARAQRYRRLVDAFNEMGDGLVVEGKNARVVAFHARHFRDVEARPHLVG